MFSLQLSPLSWPSTWIFLSIFKQLYPNIPISQVIARDVLCQVDKKRRRNREVKLVQINLYSIKRLDSLTDNFVQAWKYFSKYFGVLWCPWIRILLIFLYFLSQFLCFYAGCMFVENALFWLPFPLVLYRLWFT